MTMLEVLVFTMTINDMREASQPAVLLLMSKEINKSYFSLSEPVFFIRIVIVTQHVKKQQRVICNDIGKIFVT
jgi:hypothetical protein